MSQNNMLLLIVVVVIIFVIFYKSSNENYDEKVKSCAFNCYPDNNTTEVTCSNNNDCQKNIDMCKCKSYVPFNGNSLYYPIKCNNSSNECKNFEKSYNNPYDYSSKPANFNKPKNHDVKYKPTKVDILDRQL